MARPKGFIFSEDYKRKLSESHKGFKHSEETLLKMSLARTAENNPMFGKHHSEETKQKIGLKSKGRIAWNKDKKGVQICSEETRLKMCKSRKGRTPNFGKHHTEESKLKISIANKGQTRSEETKLKMSESGKAKIFTEEHKRKIGETRLGTHSSDETKRKISEASKGRQPMLGKHHSEEAKQKIGLAGKGGKNWNWKGGITPINMAIRARFEFKTWRKEVFERDNYTCQDCGVRGSTYLHAHHIKSFAEYPELRFEVSNGLTLCKDCHQKNGYHNGPHKKKLELVS